MFGFVVINPAVVLVNHGVKDRGICDGDVRERNAHRQAVALDGRQFRDQFFPGVRDLQAHFFHNVGTVEQYREVLRLRKAVDADMLAVVIGQRLEDACFEGLDHFVEIRELGQVFHRVTHGVVHREPAADAQHDIGAVAGNHRRQYRVHLYELDVHLNACFGGEGVVHHGLQHRTLVAACGDPDLQHIVRVFVLIAQRVVINEEGTGAAPDLVADALEDILMDIRHLNIFAGNHDQVHIQFALGHVLHSCTKRSNVVFEIDKGFSNAFVVVHELFQLNRQRLGCCRPIALFAGGRHDLVHDFVKPFAFQVHRFNGFRIGLGQVVIAETVRIDAGQHQQFPVDLVQAEDAVLILFEHRAHFAQRHFHPDRMAAFGQPEAEGVPFLVSQRPHLPAGLIAELHSLEILKGHFTVDIDRPGGQGSALVHLPRLDGDVVVTVLRHVKIPLDPFAGMRPGIAADIVQNRIRHGIRFRQGRTAVIPGVQARLAAKMSGFSLNRLAVVLSFVAHGGFRLRGSIFRVGRILRDRRQ